MFCGLTGPNKVSLRLMLVLRQWQTAVLFLLFLIYIFKFSCYRIWKLTRLLWREKLLEGPCTPGNPKHNWKMKMKVCFIISFIYSINMYIIAFPLEYPNPEVHSNKIGRCYRVAGYQQQATQPIENILEMPHQV